MIRNLLTPIVGASVGLTLSFACVSALPDHCANLNGDLTCQERGQGTFCDTCDASKRGNDGCVDEMPSDPDCHFAGDPNESTGTDDLIATEGPATDDDPTIGPGPGTETDTTMGVEDATDSDSTTTDGGACRTSAECGGDTPICEDEACVPCGNTAEPDAACGEATDGSLPVCGDFGECVQCSAVNAAACTDNTPICDAGASTCVPCTAHDQCPDAQGCHLLDGSCLDGDVLYVDRDAAKGGTGSMASPFNDIQDAIAVVGLGDQGTIRVLASASNYNLSNLSVAGNKLIAIVGTEPVPVVVNAAAGHTLAVTGPDTVVYLEGLRFEGNVTSDPAILVDAATLWADRTLIVNNSAGGIVAQAGADLRLRTCVVGRNGDEFDAESQGIQVVSSNAEILYSSIVANDSTGADSMVCTASTGTVRNSILLAPDDDSVDCAGVTFIGNAVDSDVGVGNHDPGVFVPGWFESLAENEFDLTLAGSGEFVDVATWETGDPSTDIEGVARPTVDAAPDYPGAYVYPD